MTLSLNWKSIILKILCVIGLIIVFYKFESKSDFETFVDSIEKQKQLYLKLNETYIEPKDTSLELLYANYAGEEVGNKVWKNKTLDQCTDACNKMEGCTGFSRDSALDSELANCYPRSAILNCHSNRKGNFNQMQKAIKYNSYVKSNVENVLNNCIGDEDLTLNRIIFIKSYARPNEYLGNNGDGRVNMVNRNDSNFKTKCTFKIMQGKDGIGTTSFLHIDTYKYLYRDNNNILILKDISSNKTDDKQRVSFNIYDSKSDGIMLRTMQIEGETSDKFIYADGKYLNISSLENNNDNKFNLDNAIFYIIDSIIDSEIITNKNSMPTTNQSNTNMAMEMAIPTTMPTIAPNPNANSSISSPISNSNMTITEKFTNYSSSESPVTLDTTNDILLYNNLFKPTPTSNSSDYMGNFLDDNYLKSQSNPVYMSVTSKLNDTIVSKQLNNSLSSNQNKYIAINELNKEIENEINNLNVNLNSKNDMLISGLDKMRITDLANDYFFLKTLPNKK